MAWTAHKNAEDVVEHFDAPDVLEAKADQLVQLIRKSKHMVAFTGAGVSTACGIPDFRGPDGAWTLAAQGRQRTKPTTSTTQAIPSFSHMSLVALQKSGVLKYLISQNTDGLHRRSGMPPEAISELHGNSNREYCSSCGIEYMRDFKAVASYRESVHQHSTGRLCSVCGGVLLDSVINFGENLPEEPLTKAIDHSRQADLHLVLGSSLTVSPACDQPRRTAKRGYPLVICNLQNTPLDSLATLRVFARCDDLMRIVMRKLAVAVPQFMLHRYIRADSTNDSVKLACLDIKGVPFSFVQQLQPVGNKQPVKVERMINEVSVLQWPCVAADSRAVRLSFYGNYNEPYLDLPLPGGIWANVLHLTFDPMTGVWSHERLPADSIVRATILTNAASTTVLERSVGGQLPPTGQRAEITPTPSNGRSGTASTVFPSSSGSASSSASSAAAAFAAASAVAASSAAASASSVLPLPDPVALLNGVFLGQMTQVDQPQAAPVPLRLSLCMMDASAKAFGIVGARLNQTQTSGTAATLVRGRLRHADQLVDLCETLADSSENQYLARVSLNQGMIALVGEWQNEESGHSGSFVAVRKLESDAGTTVFDASAPAAVTTPSTSSSISSSASSSAAVSGSAAAAAPKMLSGHFVGSAEPDSSLASLYIASNPINWTLTLMAPKSASPSGAQLGVVFGAGYFDDSGDVPGKSILYYTLHGTWDMSTNKVTLVKQYEDEPETKGYVVQYQGLFNPVTKQLRGQWRNEKAGTFGQWDASYCSQ